ncbi:MAG: electron transfer flavoprotein subunit alpha/FixB family protein [Bacteroidota bacterium]
MSVLVFAENSQGIFKKPTFEAASYGYDLAQALGTDVCAVSVGMVDQNELAKLGTYGVSRVFSVSNEQLNSFANAAYASAIHKVSKQIEASVIVLSETYNGRAIAPRVAVKSKASVMPGLMSLVDTANHFQAQRLSYSGKGVQSLQASGDKLLITVRKNGYKIDENPVEVTIEEVSYSPDFNSLNALAKEIVKASDGISLTEADNVVSAGRGMKGPENWGMIEELANLIGAATACSKPTADMGWRPHHEHVGQTGIQISPNLYIAIGISGAIQHLAGVSSSKNIVVINKDPEAPFFKIADFGVVGDLFDVVPQLINEIKSIKAEG